VTSTISEPYLSRTLAEKAAWAFAAEEKLDLVAINPVRTSRYTTMSPSM